MRCIIEIVMDTEPFKPHPAKELERILRRMVTQMGGLIMNRESIVFDSSGAVVGTMTVKRWNKKEKS